MKDSKFVSAMKAVTVPKWFNWIGRDIYPNSCGGYGRGEGVVRESEGHGYTLDGTAHLRMFGALDAPGCRIIKHRKEG